MSVSTHVLNTAEGRPAVGVRVALAAEQPNGEWREVATGVTDVDGRVAPLVAADQAMTPGVYHLHFDTGSWFEAQGQRAFYPYVSVTFVIGDASEHYHVPLLLSPYGYSTYRGS